MRDSHHLCWVSTHHGERLQNAGHALTTLADLLGADGSDHGLSSADLAGLAQAVHAIGSYVLAAGGDLYDAGNQTREVAK